MRKFLFICLSVVLMCSCVGNGNPQSTIENYGGYNVQKLFTVTEEHNNYVDTITVYRFNDGGNYHYFTNRAGTVSSTYKSGKVTKVETIDCE